MKGEDKALGYTWDYRQYADRNPAAYNSPTLFAEYRIREKPQYRDLKWFHSGIKNSEIQRKQQANENFALNATDFLSNFVNPNPRVKAPILAGVRHLKNIKPTVTGNDPLLAGAGNIRIPANDNAPKGNGIPDTALAAKNHQKNDFGEANGQGAGQDQAHTASSTTTQRALNIREYLNDIQAQTGYRIESSQRAGLTEYIRTHGTDKPSQQELARRRAEFGRNRDTLIRDWEKNTGQKWPVYTTNGINAKGEIIHRIGRRYDAHHIQPLENNGGNIWQNITPAANPEAHQGGVHRVGGPLRKLQGY